MLSKCIKMPKYSFKRNFFCHMGGSVTDSGLPTTPHMHYVGCTTHRVGRTMDRVGHTAHFVGHTMHCVGHSECDKKHLVTIKFKIFLSVLAFSGWKNKFFQNCSKLPKNHFRTIKILFFFPDFPQLQVWGGWVRPNLENSRFFFEPFTFWKLETR